MLPGHVPPQLILGATFRTVAEAREVTRYQRPAVAVPRYARSSVVASCVTKSQAEQVIVVPPSVAVPLLPSSPDPAGLRAMRMPPQPIGTAGAKSTGTSPVAPVAL